MQYREIPRYAHQGKGGLHKPPAVNLAVMALLGLCLMLVVTTPMAAIQTVEYQVNSGDDDAEESASGVDLNSSDLELTLDGSDNQTVAMRFTDVMVPAGEVISRAYLQFQADETSSSATTLSIQGEANSNAAPFTSATGNITARPRTSAAVPWIPASWPATGEAGIDQRTPDISTVIQQIIDQPGWLAGNSLAIIITGDGGGKRTAEAYNGDPAGAPLLHIEFGATPGNEAPLVDAGPDQTLMQPLDTLCLTGTASDDGLPLEDTLDIHWVQQSGPATAVLDDPASASTSATFPLPGIYQLALEATDGELSTTETLRITVARRINVPGDAATIQGGVDLANDGDTVIVAPGLYQENIDIVDKTITLASRYYLTGDPADIAATIIDGGGNEYVVRFDSSVGPASTITGFHVLNGVDGVIAFAPINILYNRVTDTFDGLEYKTSSGGLARGNILELNDDDGIDLNRDTNLVVEQNIIRNNKGDGIEMRMNDYSGPTLEVIIRNNIITNNEDDGIQLIDYDGYTPRVIYIERNLIAGNLLAGVGIMGGGDTHENFEGASALEAVFITGNTFVGNDHGVTGGDNLTARNNIFIDHTNIAVKNIDGGSSVAYNLFWNNGTDIVNSNADIASSLFEDPLLDVSYHPLAGSPAIDAGIDTGFPFNGPAPDLGAYETPINAAPVVSAGADGTVTWPTATINLAGSAIDDNLPAPPGALAINWTQTAGACGVVFGDAASPVTTATFPRPGLYMLKLSADDGVLSDSDAALIEVLPEPPPVDSDGDGITDNLDNCPDDPNPGQLNTDGDALGDVCDNDDDNDGLTDNLENSIGTDPLLADTDGDGLSDGEEVGYDGDSDTYTPGQDLNPLSVDTDGDGLNDGVDPIPLVVNVADGDVNANGVVNSGDLVVTIRIILGLLAATDTHLAHGDLYPAGAPDGVITLSDLMALQQLILQ